MKTISFASSDQEGSIIIPLSGGSTLSFAGLKTAILRITKTISSQQEKFDLAASFQKTIEEILYKKTKIAFKEFNKINSKSNNNIVVAGGVAVNEGIRNILNKVSKKNGFKTLFPDLKLCGDNGAMIAMVGLEKYKIKKFDNLDLPVSPRLPLDNDAKFLKVLVLNYNFSLFLCLQLTNYLSIDHKLSYKNSQYF